MEYRLGAEVIGKLITRVRRPKPSRTSR